MERKEAEFIKSEIDRLISEAYERDEIHSWSQLQKLSELLYWILEDGEQ